MFLEALGLNSNARIHCQVTTLEYATQQMSALGIDIDNGLCGFVTVDRTYSESDITLAISEKQFDFLSRVTLSLYNGPYVVSVKVIPSQDFKIISNRRYHKIEANTSIMISLN